MTPLPALALLLLQVARPAAAPPSTSTSPNRSSAPPAAASPLVVRVPGSADSSLTADRLRAAGTRDVQVTSERGEATTYKCVVLRDVLEKSGLDTTAMAAERKSAPAVAVATARDGYTVVFSIGELTTHRSDPRVFLAAETTEGPLPAEQGPVRLVVPGQRARSAYGLSMIEVRFLAENKAKASPSR